MIQLGQIQSLTVVKLVDFGCYLSEENGTEEILLPIRYMPQNCKVDDVLDVFIYTDSEDRRIATTEIPKYQVGDIAVLKVVDVTQVGAFLDWGLPKDLFVPYREQQSELEVDQMVPVFIYADSNSDRIAATTRINRRLEDHGEYEVGQEVELIVYERNEFGYMTAINKTHRAMLYKTDVYKPIDIGYSGKGFIKNIREDGKIDVSLQRHGFAKVLDEVDTLMEKIEAYDGFLPLTDKSAPDDIKAIVGMSKNVFKKAIGILYKQKKITLEKTGIRKTPAK